MGDKLNRLASTTRETVVLTTEDMAARFGFDERARRAFEIFFPYAYKKAAELVSREGRLVHYTSAEVAISILRNKEVWMRKTSTMNDFKEIEYGMECLTGAWNDGVGTGFKALLDSIFPGISEKLVELFNGWLPHFRTETYLTCLSEHLDSEDVFGRLSMWRAYGGSAGIAMVLNNAAFTSAAGDLGAVTSPVAYMTANEFQSSIAEIHNSLFRNKDFLFDLGEQAVLGYCFQLLKMAVLSTKHPGFHEEREWRVIHSPTQEPSVHLTSSIKVVRSIPQKVYRLPLREIEGANPLHLAPNDLLNRLIIGPSQHPQETRQAFVVMLEEAGVKNASAKVFQSDIPLRQS